MEINNSQNTLKQTVKNAAIYLFGHGPYREPRLIEMQYLRILRYHKALENKLGLRIDIKETHIDINFPRKQYVEDLPNLQKLIHDIVAAKIDTVLIDICESDNYYQYKYSPIIWALKNVGAYVYNCFYDDEDALLTELKKHYCIDIPSFMLPNDIEEFVELFPALTAEIIHEALDDILSRVPAGNNDKNINSILHKVHFMKNENPYSHRIPWLSHKKHEELYHLKEKELAKRRLIENIYILGPCQNGKLFDEDIYRVRNQESFEKTLNRLKELGFVHNVLNNEHVFTMEYNEFILYADPREEGYIEIFVYKNQTDKKKKAIAQKPIGSFKLQDNWKKDLKVKFIKRIDEIILKT